MEMTKQQQEMLDQITDAGMSLQEYRAYKEDQALGDTISPAEWMKAKDLPETEREKAKNIRISEANKKAGLDTYLDDKFDTPGTDRTEPYLNPSKQIKRINSKPKI